MEGELIEEFIPKTNLSKGILNFNEIRNSKIYCFKGGYTPKLIAPDETIIIDVEPKGISIWIKGPYCSMGLIDKEYGFMNKSEEEIIHITKERIDSIYHSGKIEKIFLRGTEDKYLSKEMKKVKEMYILEEKNRELERLNREIDVLIRKKEAILNG
jgi:hypothetical protein